MSKPSYNFIDGTFHFFKVFGQRPLSVLWIALWQVVLYGGFASLLIYGAWPVFELLLAYEGKGEPPEAEVLAALMQGAGYLSLGGFGLLVSALMLQGAWLRLLTRNEVAVGIPIRFGADELRLFVVNLAFWFLLGIGQLVTVMLYVSVNAGFVAGGEPGGVAVQALVNTVLTIFVVLGWLLCLLGFAPAPALSVRQRGIKLFDGFAAAHGVMLWMFLSYLVLVLVSLMGYMVVGLLQNGVILIGSADMLGLVTQIEETTDTQVVFDILREVFSDPVFLICLGVVMILQFIYEAIVQVSWHGVGAYVAVRHDGGLPPETPLEAPAASVGQAPSEG
ncbi:hypothetical protein ACFELO_05125 [Oceanicaulis sp. LC35]|uniref:hypothetical protein n=1 Tax=Oceanicaulis sp. LC35 TaxID=3349635 RepID=UPI003F83251F